MVKTSDDLEAVRTLVDALSGFAAEEQERIIRWAREKLGLPPQGPAQAARTPAIAQSAATSVAEPREPGLTHTPTKDLKSFVAAKSPNSDVQFAATVAYYYRFEAPPEQRKDEIDSETLQNACRLAGRDRLRNPRVTLNNAKILGMLDSGSEPGKFVINTVGENLVAMILPGSSDRSSKPRRSKPQAKRQSKNAKTK